MSPYLNMLEIINYDTKITNMLIIGNKMVSNWPKYRGAERPPASLEQKFFHKNIFWPTYNRNFEFWLVPSKSAFFAVIFIYLTRFFRKFARKFFLSTPSGEKKFFFRKFFFLNQKTIISIIKFGPLCNF